MPYKSKAQQAFMHARQPQIAKRWDKKTNDFASLPQKVGNNAPRKAAIARRLGTNAPEPGQQSQPTRRKVSPQVNNIVKKTQFKEKLEEAKEKNLSPRTFAKEKKEEMRETALQRRQAHKK